ncbi:MAG: hypothetical protein PHU94_01700 [Bacilli bacterium]|nr:hypothetical protein [Bacilli bacterium]MDD4407357.1 hypothetical protein [Bacilli bacterium]
MKKNVVIAASSKLQKDINKWIKYFENNNYMVLDYPKLIDKDNFLRLYPNVYREFFKSIVKADIFFLMNEDKNQIEGYVGAESFAELCFAVSQKLLYKADKIIYIMKMPSDKVQCYEEIKLWLSLKWIETFEK